MIKEKLLFEPVQGDPPVLHCNYCGKKETATQWLMATIHPFKESDCVLSVVVCSPECKDNVLQNPLSEMVIIETICKISAFPNTGGVNDEYHNYFQSL